MRWDAPSTKLRKNDRSMIFLINAWKTFKIPIVRASSSGDE